MLRTDLFKTMDRASTRFIAIRDTLTPPDPEIDAYAIDALHCRRGSFGVGYHFLITTTGSIQLCRDVNTVGSHSRDFDQVSVAIGVVGGLDGERNRSYTRTDAQFAAISDLLEFLSVVYPLAEVHDLAVPVITPPF